MVSVSVQPAPDAPPQLVHAPTLPIEHRPDDTNSGGFHEMSFAFARDDATHVQSNGSSALQPSREMRNIVETHTNADRDVVRCSRRQHKQWCFGAAEGDG